MIAETSGARSKRRGRARQRKSTRPEETRAALVAAAAVAFNTEGYHGTDTNKIARAAGFAPQTFYRHFRDKMDVFLAVYEQWQAEERRAIGRAARARAAKQAIVRAVFDHHARWRIFRRSLRWLAVEEPRAREARARSRDRQLDDLQRLPANAARSRGELLAALLTVERLFDAAADDELTDASLDAAATKEILLNAVRGCRGT